jgi:serine/threonine protein kinase
VATIRPDTQVGSYRVLDVLGKGGMGVVYLAEHVVLSRRVALKVLRPELSQDERSIGRFINEARAVNKIGHEHIVEVTDFGTTPDGEGFFVMEYLAGQTLRERLRRDIFWPPELALRVAIQIADALAASHAAGIIHRDLKAENVVLITRGEDHHYVKLLDFGVAKLLIDEPGQSPLTRPGVRLGTPQYMSPEQALGMPDVDLRTDIYALGILLFEMLTGRLPYAAPTSSEVAAMQVKSPFPSLCQLRPELPPALEELLAHMVAKDREKRFSSMPAAVRALKFLAGKLRGEPSNRHLVEDTGATVALGPGGALSEAERPSEMDTVARPGLASEMSHASEISHASEMTHASEMSRASEVTQDSSASLAGVDTGAATLALLDPPQIAGAQNADMTLLDLPPVPEERTAREPEPSFDIAPPRGHARWVVLALVVAGALALVSFWRWG